MSTDRKSDREIIQRYKEELRNKELAALRERVATLEAVSRRAAAVLRERGEDQAVAEIEAALRQIV